MQSSFYICKNERGLVWGRRDVRRVFRTIFSSKNVDAQTDDVGLHHPCKSHDSNISLDERARSLSLSFPSIVFVLQDALYYVATAIQFTMPPKFNLNARVRPILLPLHSNPYMLMPLQFQPQANKTTQTVMAPIAAFTMATLLFVYSRTSIQAAKRNAQRHREADGGQINWHNESLRRHGVLESPVKEGTVGELVTTLQAGRDERRRGKEEEQKVYERTEAEKLLRERTGKGRG